MKETIWQGIMKTYSNILKLCIFNKEMMKEKIRKLLSKNPSNPAEKYLKDFYGKRKGVYENIPRHGRQKKFSYKVH